MCYLFKFLCFVGFWSNIVKMSWTKEISEKWQGKIERWLQSSKLKQLERNNQLWGLNCTDPEWTRECVSYGWKAMDVYFPQNFTVHEDLFSGEKYSILNRQRSICQKSINSPAISPLWKTAIFYPPGTVWATNSQIQALWV